ncbi:MAG: peptidoglycan amidohydrolase family protein [Candidatus Xenobiia bacterium LiM19]
MNSLMALQGLQMGQNLLMQSLNGGMSGMMGTSMPMMNMGMGMPMDMSNFSSDVNEQYGGSFNNPFSSMGSQYPMGYNGGMGMVPGFGGMNGMSSMMGMGGMMGMQQMQMQQMMQQMMMMLMMMMMMMQQSGCGCQNQMGNHGASASASASGQGASASASVGGGNYGNYGGSNPIYTGTTSPSQSGNAAVDLAHKYLGRDSQSIKGELPNFTAAGGITNNCADFVSSCLESTGRLSGHEINVEHLEQSLKKQGYRQVPREQSQPGDVWISDSAGHTELVAEAGGKTLIGSNGSSRQKISEDHSSGMKGGRFYHKG